MKILLTNDDGVAAEGLAALYQSVTRVIESEFPGTDHEVLVVAPDRCRSECGHSVETSQPLSLQTVRQHWHSVSGTPVDCVRVAVYAMGFRPDVVFSGINAGANLGINLMVSGTFAAAREASLLGIPALAASHYRRPDVPRTWEHSPRWLAETIAEFLHLVRESGSVIEVPRGMDSERATTAPLWNVNLPAVDPGVVETPHRVRCAVDRCPITRSGAVEADGRVRFELDFHQRPRERGSDVAHCFDGKITLSDVDPYTGR